MQEKPKYPNTFTLRVRAFFKNNRLLTLFLFVLFCQFLLFFVYASQFCAGGEVQVLKDRLERSFEEQTSLQQENSRLLDMLKKPSKIKITDSDSPDLRKANLPKLSKREKEEEAVWLPKWKREVPDNRDKRCKSIEYADDLPTASVVFCFRNETKLLIGRSIHSVLTRTDPHLLKEIVLVDDANEEPPHASLLALPKVKYVRNQKVEGLMRARTRGADESTGDVVVFLDSHIEVGYDWLRPLLQRIRDDETVCALPVIDFIDDEAFVYSRGVGEPAHAGFDMSLTFKWETRRKLKIGTANNFSPYKTPAMPGGLLAISRSFFNKIGKYDPGMNVWGGENVDISLRIWMCGGSIEIVPCSRIGHVFRVHYQKYKGNFPYSFGKEGSGRVVEKNKLRFVSILLPKEYQKYYFTWEGLDGNNLPDYGDVSDRLLLISKLQCKSFAWYHKNVYPELQLTR